MCCGSTFILARPSSVHVFPHIGLFLRRDPLSWAFFAVVMAPTTPLLENQGIRPVCLWRWTKIMIRLSIGRLKIKKPVFTLANFPALQIDQPFQTARIHGKGWIEIAKRPFQEETTGPRASVLPSFQTNKNKDPPWYTTHSQPDYKLDITTRLPHIHIHTTYLPHLSIKNPSSGASNPPSRQIKYTRSHHTQKAKLVLIRSNSTIFPIKNPNSENFLAGPHASL